MKTKKRKAKPKPKPSPAPVDTMLVPLDSIHPWDKNPRDNKDAVAAVAKSIKRFGWVRPIIVNEHPDAKGEIIVGHTARLAALKLKLKQVPVRFVNLAPAEAHAAALADNRLNERALWDYEGLGALTAELDTTLFEFAGFSEQDFVRLANNEPGDFLNETTDGEKPPELEEGDPNTKYAVTFHLTLSERREVFAIVGSGVERDEGLLALCRKEASP